MSEQFDPGRAGFRGVLVGPTVATLSHSIAITERYTDQWSRLWALSYNPSEIVPNDTTMGWWLLAEFRTRPEARDFFNQLCHVVSGATTMEARHRKAEIQRSRAPDKVPKCVECGGEQIGAADPEAFDKGLKCLGCGHVGHLAEFLR